MTPRPNETAAQCSFLSIGSGRSGTGLFGGGKWQPWSSTAAPSEATASVVGVSLTFEGVREQSLLKRIFVDRSINKGK